MNKESQKHKTMNVHGIEFIKVGKEINTISRENVTDFKIYHKTIIRNILKK